MRSFTTTLAFLCLLASGLFAQHSLQLDYGGAYSTIIGSSPGGTYTLPPGGGTIFVIQPGPSPFWRTDGNAGTTAGTNFLGTTDDQPLHLNVRNGATINNSLNLATNGSILREVTEYLAGDPRGNFAVDLQAERTGAMQVASGDHALILGGRRNSSSGSYSIVVGGETNNAGYAYDIIVGGYLNSIPDAGYSFIGGGSNNIIYDHFSIIVGGDNNRAGDNAGTTDDKMYATVVGGRGNVASGAGSFIGGGGYDGTNLSGNTASGNASSVVGGMGNTASGLGSFVAGGGYYSGFVFGNTASGESASVLAGSANEASGMNSATLAGDGCYAVGHGSIAAGHSSTANGLYSKVFASYSSANGGQDVVFGTNNVSDGAASLMFGSFSGGSGSNSLTGGYQCYTGADYSVALGISSSAEGEASSAIGRNTRASANFSSAIGYGSRALKYGQHAQAAGIYNAFGDAQASTYVMRTQTTDATPTDLFLDGASLRLTLSSGSTYTFTGIITARSTAGVSDGWKIEGTIQNNGGTYTVVYSSTTNIGTNTWSIAVTNGGNTGLNVQVTGAAATSIGWVARIETAEVIY